MTTHYSPWRPIFETPPARTPVASDSRLHVVQQQDFLVRARRMGADARECKEIIDALQLCERLYGFRRVDSALPFVEGVLACAACSMSVPLSRVASLCDQPTAGALVGALIEGSLAVDPPARQFPSRHTLAPPTGLALAFGDCVIASRWLEAFGLLVPGHADRLQAYAQLVRAIRTQAGNIGLQRAAEMVKHAALAGDPERAFMRAVAEEARARRIDLGLAWEWYGRVSQHPTHIKTWLIEVTPPAQEVR